MGLNREGEGRGGNGWEGPVKNYLQIEVASDYEGIKYNKEK